MTAAPPQSQTHKKSKLEVNHTRTPPAPPRGPASESRSGAPLAARERRQRRAEQTLTFAQRAFAEAELRAVELSNLEDLEAKTRGLWWGCGGWTTRSYPNALKALSPTLWPCGKKQVERFF
jgi:hypothetical protein